jgi:hypothetical protein
VDGRGETPSHDSEEFFTRYTRRTQLIEQVAFQVDHSFVKSGCLALTAKIAAAGFRDILNVIVNQNSMAISIAHATILILI